MYLDEKGYVTTGTGNLIDPESSAQGLGWINTDGSLASPDQVQAAWTAVDALRSDPKGKKQTSGPATRGGYDAAFKNAASIRLPKAAIDKLVLKTVATNNAYFVKKYPNFGILPADAQLAMHSLAWAWGPGFATVWDKLGLGALGQAFNAAIGANDFTKASAIVAQASKHEESINPGIRPRDIGTEQMFANAAHVVATSGDASTLFYPQSLGDVLKGIALAPMRAVEAVTKSKPAGTAMVVGGVGLALAVLFRTFRRKG